MSWVKLLSEKLSFFLVQMLRGQFQPQDGAEIPRERGDLAQPQACLCPGLWLAELALGLGGSETPAGLSRFISIYLIIRVQCVLKAGASCPIPTCTFPQIHLLQTTTNVTIKELKGINPQR